MAKIWDIEIPDECPQECLWLDSLELCSNCPVTFVEWLRSWSEWFQDGCPMPEEVDMPVYQGYTTRNGKKRGYYQWGKSGKKYTYKPGSESSRKRAKKKAHVQGYAVKKS